MTLSLVERYADRYSREMEACWRLTTSIRGARTRLEYGAQYVALIASDGSTVDSEEADDLGDAVRALHARVVERFRAWSRERYGVDGI
jgi:hypothetical protein